MAPGKVVVAGGRIFRDLGRQKEAKASLGETQAAFLETGHCFRRGTLVSLDLAMVHARRGDAGKVQRLAAEMLPKSSSLGTPLRGLASLVLLRGTVDTERVSLEVMEHLAGQFRRAQAYRDIGPLDAVDATSHAVNVPLYALDTPS